MVPLSFKNKETWCRILRKLERLTERDLRYWAGEQPKHVATLFVFIGKAR